MGVLIRFTNTGNVLSFDDGIGFAFNILTAILLVRLVLTVVGPVTQPCGGDAHVARLTHEFVFRARSIDFWKRKVYVKKIQHTQRNRKQDRKNPAPRPKASHYFDNFHSHTNKQRFRAKLTAFFRILVGSIGAVFLLVALPMLWYTTTIGAAEFVVWAGIFCKKEIENR
jgi:hypothetical protein